MQLRKRYRLIVKQNSLLEDLSYHSNHEIRKEVANVIGLVDVYIEVEGNESKSIKMLGYTAQQLDVKLRDSLKLMESLHELEKKKHK